MTNAKTTFNNALDKNVLSDEELKLFQNLSEHYPYFQQAKFSLYKHHLAVGGIQTESVLPKLALLTYNRTLLYNLKELNNKSAKELTLVSTNDVETNELAIPGFKFKISGKVEKAKEEDPIISDEDLIEYEPTAAYNLESEFKTTDIAPTKPNRTTELIDGFLSKSRERKKPSVILKTRPDDDSLKVPNDLVSETLAKIYVKQGKYDQAIELYEKLMLLEPEKKSIFARSISEIKSKIE
ncbi:MAG: tetratricopeptide repeat protein [Bacteroidia bacterium]